MTNNQAVIYSFCLYVLYVLLPLIPAVLIFRLFPDTKVSVAGPFQNLTLNATGAFAAYVVTVALGFFLVKYVEQEIASTRHYAVEGIIVDLANNQSIDIDSHQYYYRFDPSGRLASHDYYFVVLLDHPLEKSETVWVKFWELNTTGGIGPPPTPKTVPLELVATSPSPQRFRLRLLNDVPVVESIAKSSF
jgi:hypothetical protein